MTKQVRMTQIARDAAKRLAVRYQAYHDAIDWNVTNGVIVWGSLLIESQNETGVHMHDESLIRSMMHSAREREAREARDAAFGIEAPRVTVQPKRIAA